MAGWTQSSMPFGHGQGTIGPGNAVREIPSRPASVLPARDGRRPSVRYGERQSWRTAPWDTAAGRARHARECQADRHQRSRDQHRRHQRSRQQFTQPQLNQYQSARPQPLQPQPIPIDPTDLLEMRNRALRISEITPDGHELARIRAQCQRGQLAWQEERYTGPSVYRYWDLLFEPEYRSVLVAIRVLRQALEARNESLRDQWPGCGPHLLIPPSDWEAVEKDLPKWYLARDQLWSHMMALLEQRRKAKGHMNVLPFSVGGPGTRGWCWPDQPCI